MKLLWHSYLVPSLGTRAMKLCTETGLRAVPKGIDGSFYPS
jgi:hypothetical protein